MNTQPRKPFQILVIDDQANVAALKNGKPSEEDKKRNPLLALSELHLKLTRDAGNKAPNWKVIVCTGAKLQASEMTVVLTETAKSSKPPVGNPQEREKLLEETDVVVLDLGDLGPLWTKPDNSKVSANLGRLLKIENKQVNEQHVAEIGEEKYSGVGFYHQFLHAIEGCQAIFVLTQHDEAKYAECIKELLDPFCGAENFRPYTAKFWKGEPGDVQRMIQRVRVLYELHQEGYTLHHKLAEIEFAASHDLPVMLCGESGTGKEYLAKHIHRRWALRKIAEGKLDEEAINRFAALNCAVLSAELGSSELFGHTRDAFSGASDLKFGRILEKGCGIQLQARQQHGAADDLAGRSGNRLRQKDCTDYEVTPTTIKNNVVSEPPYGTLFLDEFGDLDPAIQARLLRYLESWEVQMVGLAGVIKGARLRIITATSDPRFAAFAGFSNDKDRLKGQWRSMAELATPLRSDLLFRVKGQTIRATPVSSGKDGNVEDITRCLVLSHAKAEWAEDAIKQAIAIFKTQIEGVDKAEAMTPHEREQRLDHLPIFGHLREIGRFIELADAYVLTHNECGGRRLEGKVTAEVVKWLWKPSAVYRASGMVKESITNPTVAGDKSAQVVNDPKVVAKAAHIRSEFQTKMKGFGEQLSDDFTQEAVREAAQNLSSGQRETMLNWMSTFTRGNKSKKSQAKIAFVLAFQTGLEEPVEAGTVRTWFSDSRNKPQR